MKVSVVVITWNKVELLLRALAEIPAGHPCIAEVLLIDNGSVDGSADAVAQRFPSIKITRLHRNFGVTAARNVGAMNATGDVLFFLDDDGRFNFRCLEALLARMEAEPKVGAIGGVVTHFAAEDIFALRLEDHVPASASPSFTAVPAFKGGCAFVRRDAFLKVGLFPDYFFYGGEELDLGYRLFRDGYVVLQFDQAVLLHQKEINATRNRQHFYFRYRNRLFQLWRTLPFGAAAWRTLRAVASGLVASVSMGCFLVYVRGLASALVQLPRVFFRERRPMSRALHREFVRRFESHESLRARAGRLFADVRFRSGKDARSRL